MRGHGLAFGIGLAAVLIATSSVAQELPQSDNSFEVEPPVLVPTPSADTAAPSDPDAEEPPASIETLEKRLARSKEDAADAARLVKKGILAQVEAEQRSLRVLRVEAALARARSELQETQVTEQKKRLAAGQISPGDLAAASAAAEQATKAAESAQAAYEKARIEAAERDLRRQKKLLAQGSARKADVARAEEKLAALQPTPKR